MIRILSIILFSWCWLMAGAQNIVVEEFRQLHKLPIVQNDKFVTDKHNAIVDFTTSVKGLQFWADGKTQSSTTDIDGGISVMVPSGTSYIKISHPQYGTLLWKAPGMKLKGNRRYQAKLIAYDPDDDFKPQNQWLIFEISPRDAILQVDSATYVLREGYKELELPQGMHNYSVLSPFHETISDSIKLADEHPERLKISLQPQFSYLTVESPKPNAEIYVDNELIGRGKGTSQRLQGGSHRVRLVLDGTTMYDDIIDIQPAEKQYLAIALDQLTPKFQSGSNPNFVKQDRINKVDIAEINADETSGIEMAIPTGYLSISCDADDAFVYIDGKMAGKAPLITGELSSRRSHEVRIKKEGYPDVVKVVFPVTNQLVEIKFSIKGKRKK